MRAACLIPWIIFGLGLAGQIPSLFGQSVADLIHDVSDVADGSLMQASLEAQRQVAGEGPAYRSSRKGDFKSFSGTYTPPELPEDKKGRFVYGLALFSDDGCNVRVNGSQVHEHLRKDQHLPNLGESFHELQTALAPGEPTEITIEYLNTIYDDDPESPGYPDIDGCTLFLYLIPAAIAVDANRDGTIAFSGEARDATSQDAPFRFWCNDDQDQVTADGENDVVPASQADHLDDIVQGRRDLEDFTRLWLRFEAFSSEIANGTFKVGLKWTDETGAPAIKVYKSADAAGSTSYLTNDTAASAQVDGANRNPIGTVSTGEDSLILPADFWNGSGGPNANKCLIFEGASEGKGQLVITIHKSDGSEVGEGPSVWLDLKNIKKMYERGRAIPDFPHPYDHIDAWSPPQIGSEQYDAGHAFSNLPGEEKNLIVYVHGINGPGGQENEYQSWLTDSETMFKRLWHQGYKGRFAAFKWLALTPAFPFRFNESEYRAWKCGRGLAQFLNGFPNDYKRNLYSFSQGAPVCGAALTVYGASVENYVMSQAAAPAGCYDTSSLINSYDLFMQREQVSHTPDGTDDLGYSGYLGSLNVSGAIVSFYNTVDYALKTGRELGQNVSWESNQIDYKPNANLGTLGYRTYAYDSGLPNDPYPIGQRCFLRDVYAPFNQRQLTDIQESMSFVARPRSEATGANTAVAGAVTARYNVGPGSPSAFDRENSDHGGQFSRRIQELQPYYENLLGIFAEE